MNTVIKEEVMGHSYTKRDPRTIFGRIWGGLRDRYRSRSHLRETTKLVNGHPRSMPEALAASGALQVPGRDRLTGSWGGES